MPVINLAQKFSLFNEYWSPKIVGELNDSHVKVVKVKGEFVIIKAWSIARWRRQKPTSSCWS